MTTTYDLTRCAQRPAPYLYVARKISWQLPENLQLTESLHDTSTRATRMLQCAPAAASLVPPDLPGFVIQISGMIRMKMIADT